MGKQVHQTAPSAVACVHCGIFGPATSEIFAMVLPAQT